MKKAILIIIALAVLGIVAGLALPVTNLIVGAPVSTALRDMKTDDASFAKAKDVFARKCANCHTTEYKLPFYAQFPVAKQIIEADIKAGLREMDMPKEFATKDNKPVGETILAKNEFVVSKRTMPPTRYVALHWDGMLNASERESILMWVKETRKKNYATAGVPPEAAGNVLQPLPQPQNLDLNKVAMGEKVFHDKRLSKDDTIACASCHGLDKGGVDRKKFSDGVGGKLGGINSPTVFNATFQFMQFWDGRAVTLEDQADGPVNNPIEMASNWPEAIGKLQQDADFIRDFTALYPAGPTKETLIDSIATFERSLVTNNSKFDKFLMGDKSALNDQEKKGYDLFLDLACATCHVGKLLGGQSFERMGVKADYFKERGNPTPADDGRFSVTKEESDRGKLKTPTLRNIALTGPYLHDSTKDNLKDAIKVMLKYQVSKSASEADIVAIEQFLKALTGEYKGQLLK
jgi:cytochrome c peroxidase